MQTRRRGAPPEPLPALEREQRKREQLQEILEGVIASLEPGALLPSERLLMERYGVARGTAVQAIEALVSRGLVYRVHGSGTFVAEPKFRQPLTLTSFTEDMRARGMTPGSVVRSQAIVPASEVVARHLALVPGTPVVHLERVRTADGEPMALERTHLPAQRLPGLEDADLTDASLYELLERTWGVRVTEDEAALLHVSAAQPALLFQRVTRDPAGTPVEYVRSLYRGDRYEVHTRLERLG